MVRKYVIKGHLRKGGQSLPFTKELKAIKKEDAIQQLYADMGSRHKAKRFEIKILGVEETEITESGTGEIQQAVAVEGEE